MKVSHKQFLDIFDRTVLYGFGLLIATGLVFYCIGFYDGLACQ